MLVFIGSVAFNKYRINQKTPRDVDIIADYESALKFLADKNCVQMYPIHDGKKLFGRGPDGTIYEIEIAWDFTTAQSLLRRDDIQDGDCLSLDWLYTLKMSHRYLRNNPHFLKTRNDILDMRSLGAKIADEDWYKARMKETYWYEHPDLTRTKEEFFVDPYKYDHDTIHEAVAIYDRPAYTMYQREGAKGVSCSKQMFFEVNESIRLAGVVEEASVLALERSLIPHPDVKTEAQAFEFALQKVCTSITSGWFREYAWEHYFDAMMIYAEREKGLLELLQIGIENGVIRESNRTSTS